MSGKKIENGRKEEAKREVDQTVGELLCHLIIVIIIMGIHPLIPVRAHHLARR